MPRPSVKDTQPEWQQERGAKGGAESRRGAGGGEGAKRSTSGWIRDKEERHRADDGGGVQRGAGGEEVRGAERSSRKRLEGGALTVKKRSMTRVSSSASLQDSVGLSDTLWVDSNMAM